MTCASCGRENPTGARFCCGCGTSLAPRCPACGAEAAAADARFCVACGASFAARTTEASGARKVVTIVFADLAGSTALHERLDAESTRAFMDRYYRAMQGAVEAHGGTVTQLLGDGVKAVFGAPRVAEDDALRAVHAAVEMQRAFRELASNASGAVGPVGLRVAVNTGEVVAKDETEIIGDPVNVAARLQQEAEDGDVVLGESTQRLVSQLVTLAPLGTFTLKGRAEPVAAYRVVSLERPAGAPAVAFVGREDELRRLVAVYDAAVATPGTRLAVVLGSPGLGKSRLLAELGRRLGDRATILLARCEATGGATFAPIAEALRALLGIEIGAGRDGVRAAIESALPGDSGERARIADGIAALLAGAPESPEETFFVVRRLLAALAAAKPVVLAIDDLHWAEPLLLDLTEHLVQWGAGIPLLVLAAARPELREARSSLTMPGPLVADVVTLAGLDASAATRLAANVIGADALPAALAGRVLATSEGNPLFVGELVRMLVHDGVLRREGDRWTAAVELSALEMPPTIQALLAARIERLRPEERAVLERAAVVGRQFSRQAVAHLLPPEITDLDTRLEALRRSELVEPDTGWLLGEPVLRFHHVLIRDAAYRRLLKGTRAELHARFADWLEGRVGEAVEHDETLGWHLEQAHQHLRELGPVDERGRALGERASRRLAAAGRRALGRDDVPLAAGLLGRALDGLDPGDPARADLALDWCETLLAAGEVGAASAAIDELGRFAAGSERLRAWHTCFAGELAALTDPKSLRATVDAVAAAAEALAGAGDAAGEAKAHSVHASALMRLGQIGACEAALDRALAAARRVGDRRRANAVLSGAPLAALWGPGPVARASGRCLDVVRVRRITQGAPGVEAVALRCQAVLEALRGRSDAARRMIASSRRMVEELGITQGLLETEMFAGFVELIEGDAAAAEQSLRAAYEGLRDHGLGIDAARAAGLLGLTLLAQDRAAEAEALSHESEALAGDDLQAAITWRRVRAEALARRGEHAPAVELARAAVGIAAATDALLHHGDARLALAATLRASGRSDEAAAEEARAIELWEAKGATLLAERARQGPSRAERLDRAPEDRVARARPVRRRVRPNAATANEARVEAAVAARDADAFAILLADDAAEVDHITGAEYDRPGMLREWRSFLAADDFEYASEFLATLGESLALHRARSSASGVARGNVDVGPYEREKLSLVETDADGRRRCDEIFAPDHLGDAVARLYERHAELLPDGPERDRATVTAHSVAALLGPPDRWPFAPDAEATDHRTVGFGSLHGGAAVVEAIRALLQLSDDFTTRVDDVLGLRSDALLVRWTTTGTIRASGGAFERAVLMLWFLGADGLLTRWEQFDADQDAEALARFDGLATGPPAPRPARRRVRPNAATANLARLDAAIAARDADALPALYSDEMEVVNQHIAGGDYDRQGALAAWRSLLSAEAPTCRHEPLATLGDSLALCRQSVFASGFAGRKFDVGAYESELLAVVEVESNGRQRRAEVFAHDHLGDAVVRLYGRYAELLPEGPERERAAAIARSVAALPLAGPHDGPANPDRMVTALAPEVEWEDPRTVGFGTLHGAEAVLRASRALLELVEGSAFRVDDILALRSDALLVRWTHSAIDRASGGPIELRRIQLWVLGADGLVTRWVQLEADRDAEALARFEELTAESPAPPPVHRRVRPNAATAQVARLDAAIASREEEVLPTLFADELEHVDHHTGSVVDRQGTLTSLRSMLTFPDLRRWCEPLATLGDSLALSRLFVSASAVPGKLFDIGAWDLEKIDLTEVDAQGRCRRAEDFAPYRLDDGIARLYERYAALLPDGPARTRAAATARSVAVLLGSLDVGRWATAISPAVEFVDHRALGLLARRGAREFLEQVRTLFEVADKVATRTDDVLALRSDALLVRRTNFGTERTGGGAFEREFLVLCVFGADGLQTRAEMFASDHGAQALARFDELAVEPPRPMRRRVRPNAATAHAARLDAVIAARDADALPGLLAENVVVIEHTTGASYDRSGQLSVWRSHFWTEGLTRQTEPLATLGDSLALCRVSVSGSGAAGKVFDVGAFEHESVCLVEVDSHGRQQRLEVFATRHLGDTVARLYERHAELLPDGPERNHAAANARLVAAWVHLDDERFDPERFAAALGPDLEVVDHRTLGTWSMQGAEALVQNLRSWRDVADDITRRAEAILALRAGALLARWTHLGTDRASGGAYERPFLLLWTLGADGLVTRWEFFEADREAEALARFDEVAADAPAARPARRRVRPNAATAYAGRVDSAFAARDADALLGLLADDYEMLDHPSGVAYDREAESSSHRGLLGARDPTHRHEPLATLGDSLALCRLSVSARGYARGDLDVGAYERPRVSLIEVDAQGRARRTDSFAPDQLGDAVVRLYERHAELLPENPARARAAAIARSVAAMLGPYDLDRYAAAHAPAIEYMDRRLGGIGSLTGPQAIREWFGSLLEVAEGVANRQDDVLALRSDALLLRWTNFGTERAGAGAYERHFLWLGTFGADGLATRLELFEGDRDAEALARFDELTVEAPAARSASEPSRAPRRSQRRVRPNAVTANAARFDAAFAARDAEMFPTLLSDACEVVDHTTGVTYDRQGVLSSYHALVKAREPTYRNEPLATLGDSLALCRQSLSASSLATREFEFGAYETEKLTLFEGDASVRLRRAEVFAADHLGDAVARLYERYAELLPDGPTRECAAATARSAEVLAGSFDPDAYAATFAPAIEVVDHRTLGTWSSRGSEALLRNLRAWLDLADGITNRLDEILDLRSDALLARWTHLGTLRAGGGAYERPYLMLWVFGADGLLSRWEFFDADRDAEALARFDELTAERPEPRFANAATRADDAFIRCQRARDWEGVVATFAPGARLIDRRSLTGRDLAGSDFLASLRVIFDMGFSRWRSELLATRGEQLALFRYVVESEDGTGGPAVVEYVGVVEVDASGLRDRLVAFDVDALDAAYAELDARYAAGEAAPFAAVTTGARAFAAAVAARDWDALSAVLAPDLVVDDHRPLGWETLRGPAMLVDTWRSLVELAPDARLRVDHFTVSAIGSLAVLTLLGTHEGGEFEDARVIVHEYDVNGKIRRHEIYTHDQLDEARARFHAIGASSEAVSPDPLAVLALPNAATATMDRVQEAFEARDWEAVRELAAEGATFEDRRRHALVSGDRDWLVANLKLEVYESGLGHFQRRLVATAGDRICLHRGLWTGGGAAGGRAEIEYLWLAEVDEGGQLVSGLIFDPEDWRGASREAWGRWLARDAAAAAVVAPAFEAIEGWNDRDRARMRAVLADDLVLHDRRLTGEGRVDGADANLDNMAAMWDLAPDVQIEPRLVLALERHGVVSVTFYSGTLPEGGVWESYIVNVATVARGRITRLELFELEALDAALARLAELRPDPLRIPPNAATRATGRWHEAVAAGDWESVEALFAPTLVFEDRRRGFLTSGDREMLLANTRVIGASRPRTSRTVLATAGDRLELERVLVAGSYEDAAYEVEFLEILEVDGDGRLVAVIAFDPDDRRAASRELFERHARSEAGGSVPAAALELWRAFLDRDLERCRAALPADFVFHDHRRSGVGRIEGADAWIAWDATLLERSPDAIWEPLYYVASDDHGSLTMGHTFGTLAQGGEFESVFLSLMLYRGGRPVALERFEPDDLDLAWARFEALRAASA